MASFIELILGVLAGVIENVLQMGNIYLHKFFLAENVFMNTIPDWENENHSTSIQDLKTRKWKDDYLIFHLVGN